LLNGTDSWIQKGGETTYEMDSETVVETLNETDEKRDEKDVLVPLILSESRIITHTNRSHIHFITNCQYFYVKTTVRSMGQALVTI
jgi:hypothetical protein